LGGPDAAAAATVAAPAAAPIPDETDADLGARPAASDCGVVSAKMVIIPVLSFRIRSRSLSSIMFTSRLFTLRTFMFSLRAVLANNPSSEILPTTVIPDEGRRLMLTPSFSSGDFLLTTAVMLFQGSDKWNKKNGER
jgi:hypothetical protein